MQAVSSHIRPFGPSLSGSAGTARQAAEYPARHWPSAVMFAHRRQAAERPRLVSGRGLAGLRGIRRRSCAVVGYAKAGFVNAEFATIGKLDDMPATMFADVVCNWPIHLSPAANRGLFWSNAGETGECWRSVKFNAGSGFKGLHLSLPSPGRIALANVPLIHRANGPVKGVR